MEHMIEVQATEGGGIRLDCGCGWKVQASPAQWGSVPLADLIDRALSHAADAHGVDEIRGDRTLIDIDRNARAYGYEIGGGKPLAVSVTSSDENPFLDPNWRDRVKKDDQTIDDGR